MSDTDCPASECEHDSASPIIIDNGSGLIKAGYSNDHETTSVFPSVVGHLRLVGNEEPHHERAVGNDAISRMSEMLQRYPIERGIVKSWDDMKEIWDYTFNELDVDPEKVDHPVLLTESPQNPREDREQMTQYMFETYRVPAMQLANQAVLSLMSTGRITGIAIECGYGSTHIVPVFESHAISHTVLDVGGRDLTDYLRQLLMERGYTFPSPAKAEILRGIKGNLTSVFQKFQTALMAVDAPDAIEEMLTERWSREKELLRDWCGDCFATQTVRDIKEKLAYVKAPFSDEDAEEKYEMPDGNVITIGTERYRCIEPLFKPSLLGRKGPGLAQMLFDAISTCDTEIQIEMADNIVLGGGTAMLRNFGRRLKSEVTCICIHSDAGKPKWYPKHRVHRGEMPYSAWYGGSILCMWTASKSCRTQKEWITSGEYEECGRSIIHRKQYQW